MARKFQIQRVLKEEDLKSFDELCAKPGKTYDDLEQWLGEHDYEISRGAVYNYRNNIEERLKNIKVASETMKAMADAVREVGPSKVNDGILAMLQQRQAEWLSAQIDGGDLEAEELERFAKSVNQSTSAAQRNEDLRTQFDEQLKALQTKFEKGDGKITADDIADVRKAIFG